MPRTARAASSFSSPREAGSRPGHARDMHHAHERVYGHVALG